MTDQVLSPRQAVALIRQITGDPKARLPHGSDQIDWSIEDDTLILNYRVTRVVKHKAGEAIIPVSQVMKSWTRRSDGTWEELEFSQPLRHTPEVIESASFRGPLDEAERERWVKMCGRPGNKAYPLGRENL